MVPFSFRSDAQCAHFVALYGISDKQKGQSFVSGSASGSSFLFFLGSFEANFSKPALFLASNLLRDLRKQQLQ